MTTPSSASTTTPPRLLTREESMAWPYEPKVIPPRDAYDPNPADTISVYYPPGMEPPPPPKPDKDSQQEVDDGRAMALHCRGMSYRQIGQVMQIPYSTAYKMVKRHLHRLRSKYAQHPADGTS